MKKNYLALYDLDGTLFDTGEVNFASYCDAVKLFGANIDHDYFVKHCNGRHYTEFIPPILGEKATKENLEAIHRKKMEVYKANLGYARKNDHLFKMLELMHGEYINIIVTTASKKNTTDILEYFGVMNLFDGFITQEDIKRTKPDPDGFIQAMAKYRIDKDHTVIFEDSDVGIQAARATGAAVMIIDRF
jgi:beta-phosphoglucomutase